MSDNTVLEPVTQSEEAVIKTIETPRVQPPKVLQYPPPKPNKYLIPAFDVSDRALISTPRGGNRDPLNGSVSRGQHIKTGTIKHPFAPPPKRPQHQLPQMLPQLNMESLWTGLEIPPSNGDFHYLDYTQSEESLDTARFSDDTVKERLLANRGGDHLMIRWCSYCEELAAHRFRAWEILQAVLVAFPNMDFMNALPSQRPECHQKELLRPPKHQLAQQVDCKEMYIFFKPRGQPLKSLLATDGPTAVAALTECMATLENRNLAVTLLSARKLPSAGLLTKTNPFVRFKVRGTTQQENTSFFCEDTQNPDFKLQLFTFHVSQPAVEVLEIEVCSMNGKKEKQLATASVPVNDLVIGKLKKLSVPLDPAGVINVVLAAEGTPFTADGNQGSTVPSDRAASYELPAQ
eukprot:TRINITY_DN80461_c0_g1_i1.p1 TRINITY_DN80461_c0_g1~~TRINITY_DN80461_c0_g1_i1.p1  ORF type:complete len:404 (-),score=60.25 TRINITY_DN80461_c0_g1_i1:118-1329(-)